MQRRGFTMDADVGDVPTRTDDLGAELERLRNPDGSIATSTPTPSVSSSTRSRAASPVSSIASDAPHSIARASRVGSRSITMMRLV